MALWQSKFVFHKQRLVHISNLDDVLAFHIHIEVQVGWEASVYVLEFIKQLFWPLLTQSQLLLHKQVVGRQFTWQFSENPNGM